MVTQRTSIWYFLNMLTLNKEEILIFNAWVKKMIEYLIVFIANTYKMKINIY